MAEIFPNEGLDVMLGIFPKNGANLATLYLGLFTSQTAATVPAATAVLATATGVTEASGTGYARSSLAAAIWGANAGGTPDGRRTTASAVTLAAVGAGAWGTINGFLIADALTNGHAIYYANFDDLTAIVTSPGDVITITPFLELGA